MKEWTHYLYLLHTDGNSTSFLGRLEIRVEEGEKDTEVHLTVRLGIPEEQAEDSKLSTVHVE